MKKLILIILEATIITIINLNVVSALTNDVETYQVGTYAYFDPVNLSNCSEENYWTNQNTDTTCYRWIVTNSGDAISLIVDHNLDEISWSEITSSLSSIKEKWTNKISDIRLMTSEEAAEISSFMGNSSASGYQTASATAMPRQYFLNTKSSSNYGYWLSDEYTTDTSYAYRISEYGNIGITAKTSSRGLRPIITINQSYLTPAGTNESEITLSKLFGKTYTVSTHKTLQGLTIADGKLFFVGYSSNTSFTQIWDVDLTSSSYDLASITGKSNPYSEYYFTHGNAMTYNSNTNLIYITVGINDDKTDECSKLGYTSSCTIALDKDTLEIKTSYEGIYYSGIGYDEANNHFIGYSNFIGYITDNSFNTISLFDMPTNLTTQDITVHNGFVYFVCYEAGKTTQYQTFYDATYPGSSKVYVYDLDDYKLVEEYFIPSDYQEAESADFYDVTGDGVDELIIGFNSSKNEEYFTFYSVTDTISPKIKNLTNSEGIISAKLVDSLSGISYYAVTTTDSEPSSWVAVSNTSKYDLSYTPSSNGTYYLWTKDENGNTSVASVMVSDIEENTIEDSNIEEIVNPQTGDIILTVISILVVMLALLIYQRRLMSKGN